MPTRVSINGCGRIGRLSLRIAFDKPDEFQIAHLNDVQPIESVAYLIKYDSVHGTWPVKVEIEGTNVVLSQGSRREVVPYTCENKPELIPYEEMNVALVMECTGEFLTRATLQPYFDKGIKKVVVSAPVKDPNPVLNIVYGVNHNQYNPSKDHIVTAASCTTNCLAPVVKVIHEQLRITHGCITTIHNLTNTQTLVDAPNAKKSDPRISITDCVFEVEKNTTVDEVNKMLKDASETYLKHILGFEENQLVSTDFVNDARSSIVDKHCTQVIDGKMVKIYAWYDNEYGYSARLVDVAQMVAKSI
ncbi:hypothetical protein DUNSADRAFT_14740 [Dunaliella salina]|uniref:Glyceraldehyde 3-phosphate dehydrogenase NAD(P) binding domain-containing protein n=1 Tax=Dunaliella salina TaxID=3046 RepID=A0ABQ7G6T9_DUNSA|nr:hypothetical protein DUNSADRAFT_14740 [Dunaliella salina]|eukprot:KAF5830329.1 hypothetical protein DUNSADRAFT_14740 [Dunaliella salina]